MHNSITSSYWEQTRWFSGFDFCIIGAGITGSFLALHLREKYPKASIMLVDRLFPPRGATTRNAGFACFGSMSEFLDDTTLHGEDYAYALMEKRLQGLELLTQTLGPSAINLRRDGGYELFAPDDRAMMEACMDHLDAVNRHLSPKNGSTTFKASLQLARELHLPDGFQVIHNEIEGNIHSGRMLDAAHQLLRTKDVTLYSGVFVTECEQDEHAVHVHHTSGTFTVAHCFVATNGAARSLLPQLDVWPNRGQILLTHPLPEHYRKGNFHYKEGYYYLRHLEDGRVLLGGGRHTAMEEEQTEAMHTTQKIQDDLEDKLQTVFLPGVPYTIEQRWAGTMAFGALNEKEPLKGSLGRLHYLVRMGGMGVALAPYETRAFVRDLHL